MKVNLIAHTQLDWMSGVAAMKEAGYEFHNPELSGGNWKVRDADELAEFAGRLCYKSWNRPNPATAHNEGYIGNIIDHQHFSVLEHASATFYISGVSRSLTHELVRHRHLSFSQVSQRYVDELEAATVVPPALLAEGMADRLSLIRRVALQEYQEIVADLTEKGYDRKAARQAARSVLPNSTETALVVTGNLRAWREVISKRNSPHADAEIRELAAEILRDLRIIAPNSFQDFVEVQ